MALSKVTYVDGVTIIGAENLNDIQDELIRQGEQQAEDEAELALKANTEDVQTALALKADKSDTYTKSEVDTALNGKADKSTTYTKTEVDSALALKANTADVNSALALKADKSDTYTKAEVDASLALKADKADTYTKTEVDNALALKADADNVYTKTEANALLDKKADKDGTYDAMTVGTALTLETDLHTNDKMPYLFRPSGGGKKVGKLEKDTLVGGSVAWNQLVQNGNFADSNHWTGLDSVSNNIATSVARARYQTVYQSASIISGHKYLLSVVATADSSRNLYLCFYNDTTAVDGAIIPVEANVFKQLQTVVSPSSDANRIALANWSAGEAIMRMQKFNCFDLTQMFGSTIADYIYALETANAGDGVAFFKKYFPKDYYAYNAGSIESVSASAHEMVGFNQWDEEWEVGGISETNGNNDSATDLIRSKNHIPVLPSKEYYCSYGNANKVYECFFYDSEKNYLSYAVTNNGIITTPTNCAFMRFRCRAAYGTTYKNDICINLSSDKNGTYEPYVKHSYPLDADLVLRGIPKVDADGNLYYDGDVYEHDGTVTRNFTLVDMGSLNWTKNNTSGGRWWFVAGRANLGEQRDCICPKYTAILSSDAYGGVQGVALNTTYNQIVVCDMNYETAADFKTAMSGVQLVFKRTGDGITTESADPFADPQIVDNWGTEEYVSTGIVPVGHNTDYPVDLVERIEDLPDVPTTDGTYVLKIENGVASFVAMS